MPEKLKDMFFTRSSVGKMADEIRRFYPIFEKEKFLSLVFVKEFEGKELKARMRHTTECLGKVLPGDYSKALDILMKVAPDVKGFEAMCLPDFVEFYGLEKWDLSLDALELFTRYSSSEFAIRPFIRKDPVRAMDFMSRLAGDERENVRRFASEGCRPRLPWAMALPEFQKDPGPILPILEKLKDDKSEFVRKSVANNLNDISKDHPDLVLDICERWQGESDRTDWIIKRACKTMLKSGNARAMRLFGFGNPKEITVKNLRLDREQIPIGEHVHLFFTLSIGTDKTSKVRLEYSVLYVKAGGKSSKKVFIISEKDYEPGEIEIRRKLSFEDMSTRRHYPGEHRIKIIVNGIEKAEIKLILTE